MTQLREFLRHQYIGAIVIGLLAYEGIQTLISASSTTLVFIANPTARSVMGYERTAIPWDRVLPNFVQAILAISLAYAMMRWLYGSRTVAAAEEVEEPAE